MLLYIDPGSGSLILQIIIASFAGVFVLLTTLRNKLFSLFLKIKQIFKSPDAN
jgi:hypothetical protein